MHKFIYSKCINGNVEGDVMVLQKYVSLSMKKAFIEEIKEAMAKTNGYSSVAEYCRTAVREKIQRESK